MLNLGHTEMPFPLNNIQFKLLHVPQSTTKLNPDNKITKREACKEQRNQPVEKPVNL